MANDLIGIRNAILKLVSDGASPIARGVAQALKENINKTQTPSGAATKGMDFSTNTFNATGHAAKRDIGFIWGIDVWGDGQFGYASTTQTTGTDTTGLSTGERGGVVRRF